MLYFTVCIAEYVSTFIRPYCLSKIIPIMLNDDSTRRPWNIESSATYTLQIVGQRPFNWYHQMSALFFSSSKTGRFKSIIIRLHSFLYSYISFSDFNMTGATWDESRLNTVSEWDIMVSGSILDKHWSKGLLIGNFLSR